MTTYLDSSVLLRVVLGQPDRLEIWDSLIEGVSSELVRVETLRTIDRTAVRGALDPDELSNRRTAALAILSAVTLAQMSSSVLARAGDPFPTALGSLDAIHLATAMELRIAYPSLAFATHDRELAVAARSVGFEVAGA